MASKAAKLNTGNNEEKVGNNFMIGFFWFNIISVYYINYLFLH